MSQHGAGECHICTARSDYCVLQCADGQEVDCRDLQLKPGIEKVEPVKEPPFEPCGRGVCCMNDGHEGPCEA